MKRNFSERIGKRKLTGAFLSLFFVWASVLGQPFSLRDSGPGSSEFSARFMASYGVNSEIEPSISPSDRPLYEKVLPFLENNPQRAISEVENALREDSNPAFRYLLGNLYYQTDRLAEAEKNLKEAIGQFPDFRRAHRTLGLVYLQTERFEESVDSWLRVIRLGGGDAQSYGLLGYSYLALEKYESALTAYRNARMFRPESLDFRRGQAYSLLQIGEWRQAIALFDELILENPEISDFWLSQANAFLQLERYEEAIENLELVQSIGGATSGSRFLLGDLHLREGNHRLALEQYRVALREGEGWTVDQALKPVQHLFANGLIEEAKSYLEELRPRLPEDLDRRQLEELRLAAARLDRADGNLVEAKESLEKLVKENPIHGQALLLLGEIFQEEEEFEQAEFYFTRAVSISEVRVDARIALGWLEVSRGNRKAALKHLRIAQELEPRRGLNQYIEMLEKRCIDQESETGESCRKKMYSGKMY